MERYELLKDLPFEKRGNIWTIVGDLIQSEITDYNFLLKDLTDFSNWFGDININWIPQSNESYYYIDILYDNYINGFYIQERCYESSKEYCNLEIKQGNFFKSEVKALVVINKTREILNPFRDYFKVNEEENYYSIIKKSGEMKLHMFKYKNNIIDNARLKDGNFFKDIKFAKKILKEILIISI